MSDQESAANSGYSTPVPELDDHRHHQASSVSRTDRPRRGTFDSLYGAHLQVGDDNNDPPAEQVSPHAHVRYLEEAVVDDDGEVSPAAARPRGATVGSCRSESPPNSVKAFAEARRRDRDLSFSEARADRRAPGDAEFHRAMSIASRRSYRSRQMTVADEADDASVDAEDDVCFPMQDEQHSDGLRIDFDYLENFMQADASVREAQRAAALTAAEPRTFSDLRPQSAAAENGRLQPMVTVDGDFMGSPSDASIPGDSEKPKVAGAEGAVADECIPKMPQEPRFNFFSTAWESTIHANDLSGLVLPGETTRGLFSFPKGETDGVWWLNMTDPTLDEVNAVCRAFGIHPLTSEDITQQEPREKIEIFPSYYFACFRYAKEGTDEATGEIEYKPFHIYVVVFREGTLSFSFNNHQHAIEVRKRIAVLKDYVSLSSDWICYALIDHIVDSFKPFIDKIEAQTEHIEDEVFLARADDMQVFLRRIGTIRKNVMSLMRILGGKADVLKGFSKRCNENYKVTPRMDIGMYLGDIQDHIVTMMANLGHFEKMLSRSHSNYLAQITIDGIQQGTHTNKVLSKITFLASIIVPLNVITGAFGMNVKVPWIERENDNLYPFFGIIAFLFAFSAIGIVVARRLRYL